MPAGFQSVIDLKFPVAGLFRRQGYQSPPAYTTTDALNVRPSDVFLNRLRGGSRPGLIKAYTEQIGSGSSIWMLGEVDVVKNDGFNYWTDDFSGTVLSAAWSYATWIGSPVSISDGAAYSLSTAAPEGGVVLSSSAMTNFDPTQPYTVGVLTAPYQGSYGGKYYLFLRMNNSTPNAETDGVVVTLDLSGATGAYSGYATVYASGVPTVYALTSGTDSTPTAAWLTASITSTNTLTVKWNGHTLLTQAISAAAGTLVGFGMNATASGGACLVDSFRVQYYQTPANEVSRKIIVSSAGEELWRDIGGSMGKLTTGIKLPNNRHLECTQLNQKLYIADYDDPRFVGSCTAGGSTITLTGGLTSTNASYINAYSSSLSVVVYNASGMTNGNYSITSASTTGAVTLTASAGTGSASVRVERAPKVYDPSADTLTVLTATTGQVPTSCACIATYRNRLVLAGGLYAPQAWYMSRVDNPLDWNYGADGDDAQRAVAGSNTDAGNIGERITALIPHSNDYLIFGCLNSLYVLRGDPAFGGQIDLLSREIGVVGSRAWCQGPNGETIFLSKDGIYVVDPSAGAVPQSISREKLPQELRDINPDTHTVLMAYDYQGRGVHIYISGWLFRGDRLHWWFDWETKSYWPVTLYNQHQPFSIIAFKPTDPAYSGVLIGGYDGYIRKYLNTQPTDDGQAFTSYVTYGPIRISGGDYREGLLRQLIATLATSSGPINWSIYVGDDHELSANSSTAFASGVWSVAGLNLVDRVRCRGSSMLIKLANGSNTQSWAMERLTAERAVRGTLRP